MVTSFTVQPEPRRVTACAAPVTAVTAITGSRESQESRRSRRPWSHGSHGSHGGHGGHGRAPKAPHRLRRDHSSQRGRRLGGPPCAGRVDPLHLHRHPGDVQLEALEGRRRTLCPGQILARRYHGRELLGEHVEAARARTHAQAIPGPLAGPVGSTSDTADAQFQSVTPWVQRRRLPSARRPLAP